MSEIILNEIAAGEGIYTAEAARLFPHHRLGKAVSPSTVFRWIVDGVLAAGGERVRLEGVKHAGRLITTRGAVRRFLARQNQPQQEPVAITTPTRRDREHAQAAAVLKSRFGI